MTLLLIALNKLL